MKTKLQPRRVIAMLLTLALLLGAMPISAMAAGHKGEQPDEVTFKTMRMEGIRSQHEISQYTYFDSTGKCYMPANLNQNDSWVLLSYVIQKSQFVDLELYRLDEDQVEVDSDGNFILRYRGADGEAVEDISELLVPEDFLLDKFMYFLFPHRELATCGVRHRPA